MGVLDQAAGRESAPPGQGQQPRGENRRFNLDDYVDVQTRINDFWGKYPQGSIRTELNSPLDDFSKCRYRAEVRKSAENIFPDAVGYAFEIETVKGVNKTSHEENCETSAIGRALANMGFATNAATRASRQEMEKVQRMGNEAPPPSNDKPASKPQRNFIAGLWKDLGFVKPDGHHDDVALNNYCLEHWGETVDHLTIAQATQVLDNLKLAVDNKRKTEVPEYNAVAEQEVG